MCIFVYVSVYKSMLMDDTKGENSNKFSLEDAPWI